MISTILKASKIVHGEMVFDIKKYVYSESVFNSLYIEIKRKCFISFFFQIKKVSSHKISGTKNGLFFLSRAHHSFTFNL